MRNKVLDHVFASRLPKLVMKFLLFISVKNRLNMIEFMITSFDDLYLAMNNRVRARVVTALEISPEQKQSLTQVLNKKYAKTISADWEINNDILGGFKIFIEGNLHDSSFTTQLEMYKQKVLS